MNRYRLEFYKTGKMRFVGHLDTMKMFQRAVKRSRIPIAYSKGFNPHQLMGFAVPLPLGTESMCECMELELTEDIPVETAKNMLNEVLPDGVKITFIRKLAEKEKNAASIIAAADYEITLNFFREDMKTKLSEMMQQNELLTERTSKGKTKIVDIKKFVFLLDAVKEGENSKILARIATGSAENLKPDLLTEYICKYLGHEFIPYEIGYMRKKLYRKENGKFVALTE